MITGGTGLIGSNVCKLLTAQGRRVRALVRPGSETEPSGLTISPRRWSRPSVVIMAWPAIGVRQEPSSTASMACSAATQVAVGA